MNEVPTCFRAPSGHLSPPAPCLASSLPETGLSDSNWGTLGGWGGRKGGDGRDQEGGWPRMPRSEGKLVGRRPSVAFSLSASPE